MKKYLKQTRVHSLKHIDGRNSKRFHWNILTVCNLHCDYCYSRAADFQWNKITTQTVIDEVIENISNVNGLKEVFLLGGEPTMHPKYFYIIDKLFEIGVDVIGNISNGMYKNYKEFIDKHEKYKDVFYWNITYHPSEVEDDMFFERIKYIKEKNYIINVNFLLNVNFKDRINKMMEFCNNNNIPIYPSFLFENSEFVEFNDIEWLKEINEKYKPPKELYYHTENGVDNFNDLDTYMNDLNSFVGWKCINNSFVIPVNQNKFVQFCTNDEFSVDKINSGNSEIICPLKTCICPSRLGDEKFRTTSE